MVDFPALLVSAFLREGFTYQPMAGLTAVVDPEIGAPLTRRRYSGKLSDLSGSVRLLGAEKATLYNFWFDTCAAGSLPFTWTDPLLEEACTFIFLAEPVFTPMGGARWHASLRLRRVPT